MNAGHRFAPALVLALAGLGMLAWSWGGWPNLQVDFGRELYVPWRLGEGEVLYRDIPWFDGPLPPYLNAFAFRLFGTGLTTLVGVNLVLVATMTTLLHALLARTRGRLAATTACFVFVTLFAFSRIDTIGNDNYLTPYSHGVTHGLLLALVGLQLFARRDRLGVWAAFGSGLALGGVALTKAELFLAAAVALGAGFALDAFARRQKLRAAALAAFAAGALAPPLCAFGLLASAMPLADAAAGTLGTWSSLAGSAVASQHFYRDTLGVAAFGENLAALARFGAGWAAAFGIPAGIALFVARSGNARPSSPAAGVWLAAGAGLAAFLATVSAGDLLRVRWPDVLRPLPFVLLVLATTATTRVLRRQGTAADARRDITWIAFLLFSGVLLAKIAFRVRLDQYGFALAMPGTLAVVAAFVALLPAWVERRGGDAATTRAAALGIVAAVVVSFGPVVATRFAERSEPIGRGPDTFRIEPEKAAARAALEALEALPPGATLAVLPEGVMLNYLARRVNPTGIVNFMPPELIVFGEDRIVAAFEANPPDFVALMHKDTAEYGVGLFGTGYGNALHAWVMRSYRARTTFGDPPLQPGSRFGVQILERKAPPPAGG